MTRMSRLDDDDRSPEVTVVEEEEGGYCQALSFRVGPVFYGNTGEGPAIWVSYQMSYLDSPLAGPVLIDPVTWRELTRAVNGRLRRWRYRRLRARWHRVTHPSEW